MEDINISPFIFSPLDKKIDASQIFLKKDNMCRNYAFQGEYFPIICGFHWNFENEEEFQNDVKELSLSLSINEQNKNILNPLPSINNFNSINNLNNLNPLNTNTTTNETTYPQNLQKQFEIINQDQIYEAKVKMSTNNCERCLYLVKHKYIIWISYLSINIPESFHKIACIMECVHKTTLNYENKIKKGFASDKKNPKLACMDIVIFNPIQIIIKSPPVHNSQNFPKLVNVSVKNLFFQIKQDLKNNNYPASIKKSEEKFDKLVISLLNIDLSYTTQKYSNNNNKEGGLEVKDGSRLSIPLSSEEAKNKSKSLDNILNIEKISHLSFPLDLDSDEEYACIFKINTTLTEPSKKYQLYQCSYCRAGSSKSTGMSKIMKKSETLPITSQINSSVLSHSSQSSINNKCSCLYVNSIFDEGEVISSVFVEFKIMESKIIEKAIFDWYIFHDEFVKCKFNLIPDGQFTQILVNVRNNSLRPLNLSIKFESENEEINKQTFKSVSIEQTSFKIDNLSPGEETLIKNRGIATNSWGGFLNLFIAESSPEIVRHYKLFIHTKFDK